MQQDLLPLTEQTELDEPIKVRLPTRTDARNRLCRQMEIARGDGQDPWTYAASRAVGGLRQKTNVVIKTRAEVRSLYRAWTFSHPRSENAEKAIRRLIHTVDNELKRQGLDVERSDKYHPEVVEIEGAGGEPPAHPPYQPGDVIRVPGRVLGMKTQGDDGEMVPSEALTDVTVDMLGSEMVLIRDRRVFSPVDHKLTWIPHDEVDSVNREENERREIRKSIREKRKQADMDDLLDLCKRHAIAEAERVWPGGTVPVEDIEFRFNERLTYHGGFYFGRHAPRKGGWTPVIELSAPRYYNRGLAHLLDVVRHELIHAWQDFHPDGHPPDAHKHHGRDFKQWVEPLNTH